MKFQQAVERFCRSLRANGRAVGTEESYTYLLERWGKWLEECTMQWTDAMTEDIEEFLEWYATSHSTTSNAHMLTCLKSFYSWAVRRNHVPSSPAAPIPPIKRERPLPRALPRWQIRALIERMDAMPVELDEAQVIDWQRNRLIVLVFLYTGMRLSEVASLRWEDIDLDAGTMRVLGKGNKERIIPIHPLLFQELIKVADTTGPLFFSRRGGALTNEGISEMFRRWVKQELNINCTAHQLRHTFATELRRRRADLREIQTLLGHANLNTTEIYTAVYTDDLQEAVNRLPEGW